MDRRLVWVEHVLRGDAARLWAIADVVGLAVGNSGKMNLFHPVPYIVLYWGLLRVGSVL